MLKNTFKKLISSLCIFGLLVGNCFAAHPKKMVKIMDQFWKDSLEFQYDPAFISGKWKEIVALYNAETGNAVSRIEDVPRSYSIPKMLSLHDTKKMVCSTQCVHYSELFKKAGYKNYIIHVARHEMGVDGTFKPLTPHDNLIYFDPDRKCWKMVDFTAALEEIKFAREKMKIEPDRYDPRTKTLFELCFEKNLADMLKESSGRWYAVGYYDGDSIKDLRELANGKTLWQKGAKEFRTILDQCGYGHVETVGGKPRVRLS